jgi:hypothetical protein
MTTEIKLGRKDMVALVDDCDADLQAMGWHAHKAKGNHYYACSRESTGARQRYWLHNEVMQRVVGMPLAQGELVDHINRDRLDNRRANLRIATKSENEANKVKGSRGVSRFKGVSKTRAGNWKAEITVEKTRIYLGTFGTEVAAAKAYNEQALDSYGEFATLNEIEE